ncbi:hypothetical protein F5Y19DRAFT_466616 [Xylariaceae sp. FL1651]|nr:hypothetical protein F5Y19DRAFT_466616 [Xylariaceae sp. FL1651]
MSSDRPRPELSTIDGYNRKYGRYDFKRFDHLVSQHASLGAASLGKIHVDCKFLFKKSQWGTLEDHDAAGIIYLDLAFSQPKDCRLKSATVQVTLDDDDEHLVRQFPAHSSRPPVQIVKYGPRHMTGEPQYERVATRNTFIPSVDVGPFGGAGGVGRESAKVVVRECRWMFESHLMTGGRKRAKNNWAYKVLQWHVTENELESQSLHSNTVHTAFSFVHGGQPFFMRVEVNGRLESRTSDLGHQIRHQMRKLRFPANPQSARYATTLINFNGPHKYTTPLDGLVQGLELAMEHDNMTAPVEVKRPQRPRFYEDQPPAPVQQPSVEPHTVENLLEGQEDHTAPTIDNIASLSSRWLMAPPVAPLAPISESGLYDDAPMRPLANTHMRSTRSQRQDESIPVMEVNMDEQDSNIVAPQTGSEHEETGRITVVTRPKGLQRQVSADQVDLGTVVFLMRIWMMQTIATLLGSWGDKSAESPAGG